MDELQKTGLGQFYEVGDYKISKVCHDRYIPCRHYVTSKDSDTKTQMSAVEIFFILKQNNVCISHFLPV
jgi:hypothetical protein